MNLYNMPKKVDESVGICHDTQFVIIQQTDSLLFMSYRRRPMNDGWEPLTGYRHANKEGAEDEIKLANTEPNVVGLYGYGGNKVTPRAIPSPPTPRVSSTGLTRLNWIYGGASVIVIVIIGLMWIAIT